MRRTLGASHRPICSRKGEPQWILLLKFVPHDLTLITPADDFPGPNRLHSQRILPIDNEAIHLVRATDRKMRKAKEKGVAYQFARLSGRERAAPVEAFVVEVSNTSTMNRAAYHAGEEIFFVLDGVIELELTDRTFRLAKGDYLQSRAA